MVYSIKDIERLTEAEAKGMALESMKIKGFDIYFVDFDGYFGYSCLVYKDGHYIYYANDYQLHHGHLYKEKGQEGLRQYYIDSLYNKLFMETEFAEPLKNYEEYSAKSYFMHNYYIMLTDYISAFFIHTTQEEEEEFKKKVDGMYYDPVGFGYVSDPEFVRKHVELYTELERQMKNTANNFEYQKSAFLYEMYNHEYGINWEADFEVLSCFGKITWGGDDADITRYFDELRFNETQRAAYEAAREEYYEKVYEEGDGI